MTIEKLEHSHWDAVKKIYEEGIATGNATFQTEAPGWNDWDRSHLQKCRIVACDWATVLGWAALTPVSSKCVYAGVAEVSVYVSASARSRGVGKLLLQTLIELSQLEGFWTLQSGIFPENAPSVKLHVACGFRIIGCREKIGKRDGVWRDNLILERRSTKVGL